ncbi:membrane integrity-associated transporter subunit PqiC [Azotobacter chroococcum subsp. isscasi]|uniref:PqiC family protein n=1 Tax=Azotobacter chroococcum TaxID=353 RepID=UPI0010403A8A|nr:ABC-type transport auxiliary lipoprotein family protein [Azotobacter chroococcum]TBW13064.1 membrane integrity-associated transporter subunit PqiC [Azotobacter chroococcum subsp. isscasi]
MRFPRFRLLVLLAALSLLGACSFRPTTTLYRLDGGDPAIPERNGMAVLLGPVTLADYLRQDTLLVQRHEDGSLSTARNARWAGDLKADIDQLLLRQLAWRLDSHRLVPEPGAPGFKPDVQVQLNITRLDSGPKQPAVLEAQWRLLDRQGRLRESRLIRLEEPHQNSSADQVRAQSLVLQRLAEQLAAAIRPLAKQQASAPAPEPRKTARAVAPKVEKKPPQVPDIPIVSPTRDVEVFRF